MLLLEELVIPENGLNLPTIADQDQSSEKEIGISINNFPTKIPGANSEAFNL